MLDTALLTAVCLLVICSPVIVGVLRAWRSRRPDPDVVGEPEPVPAPDRVEDWVGERLYGRASRRTIIEPEPMVPPLRAVPRAPGAAWDEPRAA